MASVLVAGELDDKLIRLIGPHAKFVYGVDLDQSKNSNLNKIFPMGASGYLAALPNVESKVHEIVKVEGAQSDSPDTLLILRGVFSPSDFQPKTAQTAIAGTDYEGVSDFGIGASLHAALIDPNTAIVGSLGAVREALDRWRDGTYVNPEASALEDLSRSYDNWFFAHSPLEPEPSWPSRSKSVYGSKLKQALESIQGGIRFGGSIEIHLEATTESPEDALTVAAIGRWFPGFWQLQNRNDLESAVLDLAEDMTIGANGKVASLSFRLSESRLRALADSTKAPKSVVK